MKTSRRSFLRTAAATSAVLSFAENSAQAAPSKIRLGTLLPKGSTYYRDLQSMGEKWRTASNGAVSLTIYPDGAMGGEAEMVRRIRLGQLQAGMLTAVGLALIEPAVSGLQNLPMMFQTLEDVDYIGVKLRDTLEKKMSDKGFVVLFWADAGWVRFFTRTPVKMPEDMKKLKLFSWAGDPNAVAIPREMGLHPVALETADILPGLKTGLIDAVPMPPFAALAAQVDTVAPYMLAINYAPLVGAAVITKKTWDAIPENLRTEMLKAAEDAGKQIKEASRKEANESVAAMEKRGLHVYQPTPSEVETWRTFISQAYPKIRGTIVPEDVFDEVKKLLDERHQKGAGS